MTEAPVPYDDHGLGPDDPPHPYLHAVGRLTLACGGLEFWLYHAVVELQLATADEAAADGSIGRHLERMRGLLKRLPAPEREPLRVALEEASQANTLRNAVAHGITFAVSIDIGKSWRPHRSKRSTKELPEGHVVRVTRAALHEAVRQCHRLSGLIQVRVADWHEMLGIPDEDDADF